MRTQMVSEVGKVWVVCLTQAATFNQDPHNIMLLRPPQIQSSQPVKGLHKIIAAHNGTKYAASRIGVHAVQSRNLHQFHATVRFLTFALRC